MNTNDNYDMNQREYGYGPRGRHFRGHRPNSRRQGDGMGRQMRGGSGRPYNRKHRLLLEPAMLTVLMENPAHGYQVMEALKDMGEDDINPSMIYRGLAKMEMFGWVVATEDESESKGPARKTYAITDDGIAVLKDWIEKLEIQQGKIEKLIQRAKEVVK